MTTWWSVRKETIGVFLKQKLGTLKTRDVGGNDDENVGLTPLTASSSLIGDELSEGLSVTSSDTSNATKDGDIVDSLSYTEEEEEEDDDGEEEEDDESTIFNGEPPSVIMVAVMVSSFDCDDDDEEEDDELIPQSTISVLQQLFDDLEEDELGTGNFQVDSRTIVSALSSVMTQ